ncbi:MAG: 4Fe-4S dicluster domain-containing protein [Eggerthellales bacterium]|nr:4Fe-4S dicluster domain-containing protein [Eggerthellales bacterium]
MGAFKLGGMTLKSVFKKPETIQYPAETKTLPEGMKGHIVCDIEDCNLCSLCAKRCPAKTIQIDKAAQTWSINRFQCVQCGACVRECPKGCLTMEPTYTAPSTSISVTTYAKEDAAS